MKIIPLLPRDEGIIIEQHSYTEAIQPYSKCDWSNRCDINTFEWIKCMDEIQFHNQRQSVYFVNELNF